MFLFEDWLNFIKKKNPSDPAIEAADARERQQWWHIILVFRVIRFIITVLFIVFMLR